MFPVQRNVSSILRRSIQTQLSVLCVLEMRQHGGYRLQLAHLLALSLTSSCLLVGGLVSTV